MSRSFGKKMFAEFYAGHSQLLSLLSVDERTVSPTLAALLVAVNSTYDVSEEQERYELAA